MTLNEADKKVLERVIRDHTKWADCKPLKVPETWQARLWTTFKVFYDHNGLIFSQVLTCDYIEGYTYRLSVSKDRKPGGIEDIRHFITTL